MGDDFVLKRAVRCGGITDKMNAISIALAPAGVIFSSRNCQAEASYSPVLFTIADVLPALGERR